MTLKKILLLITILLFFGCSSNLQKAATFKPIHGHVVDSNGKPLSGIIVILNPIKDGYPMLCSTNAEGAFISDGAYGPYIYSFLQGKYKDKIPEEYMSPNMNNIVEISDKEVICVIKK